MPTPCGAGPVLEARLSRPAQFSSTKRVAYACGDKYAEEDPAHGRRPAVCGRRAAKKRLVTMVVQNLVMEGSYDRSSISVDEDIRHSSKCAAIFKVTHLRCGPSINRCRRYPGKKVLFEAPAGRSARHRFGICCHLFQRHRCATPIGAGIWATSCTTPSGEEPPPA